ncbi:MAG TPA: (5-formylfuran-3-yl)methyl phosphate synthase [Methanocella sp.]|nr:(5-formylfuran-3-yl)methyl phosphate synthase [Methanocella sp.]
MKLLVSPINIEEAMIADSGGADIIDVKNPKEGSLGANFPWVIQEVKSRVAKPLSATIGDFNYKPGTASLAALGAAVAGAKYVKVGLYDIQTEAQAYEVLLGIVRAVKTYDRNRIVVASGYSDYARIGSLPALELPAVAGRAGCDVVMVDTGVKDGRSTFEFMGEPELRSFVDSAHSEGLECALAGSIKFRDISVIRDINPDIIGVRGLVCGGDRNESIKADLIDRLRAMLN